LFAFCFSNVFILGSQAKNFILKNLLQLQRVNWDFFNFLIRYFILNFKTSSG
jgi:hypothetical protein